MVETWLYLWQAYFPWVRKRRMALHIWEQCSIHLHYIGLYYIVLSCLFLSCLSTWLWTGSLEDLQEPQKSCSIIPDHNSNKGLFWSNFIWGCLSTFATNWTTGKKVSVSPVPEVCVSWWKPKGNMLRKCSLGDLIPVLAQKCVRDVVQTPALVQRGVACLLFGADIPHGVEKSLLI